MLLTIPRVGKGAVIIPGLTYPRVAGQYILSYASGSGRWTITRGIPSRLSVVLRVRPRIAAYHPAELSVALDNTGNEDWHGRATVEVGHDRVYADALWIGSGDTRRIDVAWSPGRAGIFPLIVRTGDRVLFHRTVSVYPTARPQPQTLVMLSVPVGWSYAEIGVLALLLLAGSFTLWRRICVA
jgi:hypothetical protein